MRQKYMLLGLLYLFLHQSVPAQSVKGFTIRALMQGLNEGEKATLFLLTDSAFIKVAAAKVVSNTFKFTGVVANGPGAFTISFDQHPHKDIQLYADNNEEIEITGDIQDSIWKQNFRDRVAVTGSATDRDYGILYNAIRVHQWYDGTIYLQLRSLQDSLGFNPSVMDGIHISKAAMDDAILRTVIQAEYYNKALPIFLTSSGDFLHKPYLPEAYRRLNEHDQSGYFGQKLKKLSVLSIGRPFPTSALADMSGKKIALDQLIKQSKFTIIHFWSSGSYQVDDFQQELFHAYNKYHDKGLQVIGIYSDTSAKKWRLAAADLTWMTHVSDLKGEKGVVENLYREVGDLKVHNTTNVLVDAQGKIIGWDIYGPELLWHLYKVFGE